MMRKRKWQTLANEKSLTWTRLTPPPWIVLSIQWCRNYPLSALLTEVPVPSEADHRAVVALDGASVKDATDTVCMTLAHQSINLPSFEVLDGDPRFICKRDRSMTIFKNLWVRNIFRIWWCQCHSVSQITSQIRTEPQWINHPVSMIVASSNA